MFLDSAQLHFQAVREGLAAGLLPSELAQTDPDLVPLTPPQPELHLQLWVLVQPNQRGLARVRAVLQALDVGFGAV